MKHVIGERLKNLSISGREKREVSRRTYANGPKSTWPRSKLILEYESGNQKKIEEDRAVTNGLSY